MFSGYVIPQILSRRRREAGPVTVHALKHTFKSSRGMRDRYRARESNIVTHLYVRSAFRVDILAPGIAGT